MNWAFWIISIALVLVAAFWSPKAEAQPTVFYVAPNGSDTNPGTEAKPFATLERARDAIRAIKPRMGVTVLVRGGSYYFSAPLVFDAQDSGAPDAPIVYRAYPGEEVRLVGGITVPPEAFKPVSDPKLLERLDPAAHGKVMQADLRAVGVTHLGSFPVKFQGAPVAPELFFNDQRMTLARWPNEGWATIARIIAPGAVPRVGHKSTEGGVFEYEGDRPARWNVDAGVWLLGYWCFDWYAETIQVKTIDREKRQITLAAPTLYGIKQGNPSPRRYCALNLLEELDAPGEYYIDRISGLLYFIPPSPIEDARIVLSTLNGPIIALKDASNITLRGFVIEASLGNGIEVSGGQGVRIQACEVRNTRQLGINIQGGTGHRVEACDIHDTGTGGIVLAGGDRKTLAPAGHEAVNNHIWRFSQHKLTYSNAITLAGVGNRAAHNLIHDAPHQAITAAGNDHVFEYNVVHHICTETDDCGAFYKGRNPSCRGNIIRYNFWHNIGSPRGHGNAAVYFDDGDGGDTVFGNVFFRCGEPGKVSFGTVFSHGGHDNLAENNIFIECKRALGSSPWNDKRWKEAISGGLGCQWHILLLKEVDITKPPYTTRYPELVGFMEGQPAEKRINRAVRNLIVMCADVKSGNWQVDPEQNLITDRDPGFVNAAKGDFRLRPDSEVFKRLPGFQPIPFEKMGLYADELRPNPPIELWTYEPPKPLPPLPKSTPPAPKPRVGPPPVFKVPKSTGPITIDGIIAPSEWGGADPAKAMLLAQDFLGNKAEPQSRAWLAYDQDALYIAVDNTVHPNTKLEGNKWGANDALEVSVQVIRPDKRTPIYVVRAYPNGFLQFGTTQSGDTEPNTIEPSGITFKASIPERGRWTAEIRIPFRMLNLDPTASDRVAFNLTVRKAHDNLWLMWEGTRGHSFNVSQAGFIEFER